MAEQQRTAGRRRGDKERSYMRQLEISARNFVAHAADHPEERLYPFTRAHVDEVTRIFSELDKLRDGKSPEDSEKSAPVEADGTKSASNQAAEVETSEGTDREPPAAA
jgi:hypothetical protein